MKRFYCVVFLSLASVCAAQSDEESIPIFNLDDFYVEPKMNLSVGFRALTGSKLSIVGSPGVTSTVSSVQGQGDETSTGVGRSYHDGYVALNDRKDGDGNPISDGRTNTWYMLSMSQIVEDGNAIAMHTYTADIHDDKVRQKDPGNSYGAELAVSRDMGKLGSKIEWKLLAGFSINNVDVSMRDFVTADVTTLTDIYRLYGQTPPTSAPYTAPSTVVNEDNTVVDTSILLPQKPDSRSTSTVTGTTDRVANTWQLKGTFISFRAGPSLTFAVSPKFRFSVSAGPSMVYIGTIYNLEQALLLGDVDPVINDISDEGDDWLTGYYVDANVEYVITDRAGLYLGGFYQSNGEYVHDLKGAGSNYSAKLDLSGMQGLRAGLNYRF